MSKYETVIGLEVHAELSTKSKIFCGCPTEFGAPPNTHTCPICLGHPGVLPVTNKQAVEFAMKAALALNCEISRETKFDRKNYFYPDSPKAYQISQYDQPIGYNGWIDIESTGDEAHRDHPPPPGGRRGQADAQRLRRRIARRLQPRGRTAHRDRVRAGHPLAGRSTRLSGKAESDHPVHGSVRRAHGARLAALRCQRVDSSIWAKRVRYQDRAEKYELLPQRANGAGIRSSAPDRGVELRRYDRAGNPPLG